jgi:sterol desaturase/sphingolipid hydroxylase (fatty acid hydroxylase superfamily)
MEAKFIALAIPIFFILIGLEILVARWQGVERYGFEDSITNLSCGIGQQILGTMFKGGVVGAYVWVYQHWRLHEFSPSSVWAWVLVMLGVDLCYYWYHRGMHRVGVLWAGHTVHHQSEELNLTVALRQAWLVQFVGWLFYLPLAVAGFPPVMFLVMTTVNTLYQFWIHMKGVPKLGPLEWVLSTPSQHRAHHAINPVYIDKNYAGMFIIWDRLFGTFVEEDEEPVYGTVQRLNSWNPLWANLEYLVELWRRGGRGHSWTDRLTVWFRPPGWDPALGVEVPAPPVDVATYRKYRPPVVPGVRPYVVANFVLVTLATTGFLVLESTAPRVWVAVVAALLLVTLVVWGGLFERRGWARPLEALRLVAVTAVLARLWTSADVAQRPLVLAGLAVTAGLALWLWRLPRSD